MGSQPRLFMGVDVSPSGPPGSWRQRYHVVVIDDSIRLVTKLQEVSLASVIRVAWEYRPEVIAIDNALELAPGGRPEALAKVLSLLPPGTRLVQVTASDEGFIDIREAAKRAGIDVMSAKPSPTRTAFLAAAIATKGLGLEVGFTREKTYIVVARSRGTKAGGWSQQRYQRRVRASVKLAADKVKEALEKAGIDFDVFYRTSEGGIDSAIFIVYAPREKLYGVVRPHRGIDYWVRIETRYEGELTFKRGDEQPERPIIVGVDAGMTTGLAVIGLDGRVLHLDSYKEADRGSLIDTIKRLGRPLVVSTDVADPPELVRKLAAQLGAKLYTPPYNLSVEEKEVMASKTAEASGLKPRTPHERDSLAAAYRALMELNSKLAEVEAYANKFDLELDVERLKADVVRGLTVAEALEKQINELIGEDLVEPAPTSQAQQRPLQSLQRQHCDESDVELLRAQKEALEREVNSLKEHLYHVEREAYLARKAAKAELMKDEEVRNLKAQVASLSSELERLRAQYEGAAETVEELRKALLGVARGELVIVRRLEELRLSEIKRSEQVMGPLSKGELVLVERTWPFEREAVKALAEVSAAVMLNDVSSPLAEALMSSGVPVLPTSSYRLTEVNKLTLAPTSAVKDAYRLREQMTASSRADELLESMLRAYRSQRLKGEDLR